MSNRVVMVEVAEMGDKIVYLANSYAYDPYYQLLKNEY